MNDWRPSSFAPSLTASPYRVVPCDAAHFDALPFAHATILLETTLVHEMIDAASYMAHGYCLLWKPWLVTLHAGSDLLIALSYFAIPLAIWMFMRRRPDLELRRLAILFAAFIGLCGVTHLIQLVTLWWGIYEIQGFAKLATALVSVATAFAIFPLIPVAAAIPSPRQLQAANRQLSAEIASHNTTLDFLRSAHNKLEARVSERTAELEKAKARYEALVRATAQIVWTTTPEGVISTDSLSWRAFTGQTFDEWKGWGWLDAVHPDDRERTRAAWQQAVKNKKQYEIDYRLSHNDGEYRWTTARAVPLFDANGEITEWVGLNEDITERKRQEAHLKLVMRELSHRTKNLLAIIQSIARRTFASAQDLGQAVQAFNDRLQGLSVSHDLLVHRDWRSTSLEDLVRAHLAPFGMDEKSDRVTICGPYVGLRAEAAQNLGLALHELATNAAKHGALNQNHARLEISWRIEQRATDEGSPPGSRVLMFAWREPDTPVEADARREGFGSMLLERLVPLSILGHASYTLSAEGVSWTLEAPLEQLVLAADA